MKKYIKSDLDLKRDRKILIDELEYHLQHCISKYKDEIFDRPTFPDEQDKINHILYSSGVLDEIFDSLER